MAQFEVTYSDSGNGWEVTVYWECEYGDTTAYMWWEENRNIYGRTFAVVEKGNSSNKINSGEYLTVGVQYYLQCFRDGSWHSDWGPFTVTAPDPPTYTISYNANGGSGAPSTQYKTHGVSIKLSTTKPTKGNASAGSYTVTLNANGGSCSKSSLSATRTTKYTFSKWNTRSNGNGTSYSSGQTYSTNADLYLYAIYTSSTSTASVTLPTPTRSGYEFLGWATSATASSGTTGEYTPSSSLTLYAVWKALGFVYIYNGTSFDAYQVFIYNGSSWDMYCPYVYNGSSWSMCS